MVALVFYDVPTGRRARIEDLGVLETHRGGGVGEALMRKAMSVARQERAHVLDLTSNPSRTEANGLYRKLGFQLWETNVYRLTMDDNPNSVGRQGAIPERKGPAFPSSR